MTVRNKKLIQQRFDRARPTYDQNAPIQARMAEALTTRVRATLGDHFPRILEIGCGTGLLTRQISAHLRFDQLLANDLVEACRTHLPPDRDNRTRFISGDAEHIESFPGSQDLIISNATFQWLQDLSAFLPKMAGLLKPGGGLAFTSFGPDNFKELARVRQPGLSYPDLEQWERLLRPHFDLLLVEQEVRELRFPGPWAVLKHMQTIGVNSLAPRSWTRTALRQWIHRYQAAYGDARGVPLTYHPLYFIARRPACRSSS